jgi:hypothetical protein
MDEAAAAAAAALPALSFGESAGELTQFHSLDVLLQLLYLPCQHGPLGSQHVSSLCSVGHS